MPQQSKLEWTEYKSRFRAVTAYGTYWVDTHAGSAGYQLICGTNPCCEVFSSPQEAKDCAQTIHDRPSSRDDWFNLSDVEQAPYHAPLDLSELLRTYEGLLAGDNLPERIAVQTVDLRALLEAAKTMDVAAVRIMPNIERFDGVDPNESIGCYDGSGQWVELGTVAAIRALSAEPAQGEQSINCTICNDKGEVQRPDSEFLSSCPECHPTEEAGK